MWVRTQWLQRLCPTHGAARRRAAVQPDVSAAIHAIPNTTVHATVHTTTRSAVYVADYIRFNAIRPARLPRCVHSVHEHHS
eukprot:3506069-Pleurochrysis_carterae.AAC.1